MKKSFAEKKKRIKNVEKAKNSSRRAKDLLHPSQPWLFFSLTEDPISVAAPDRPAPGKEDQGWELTLTS